MRETRQEQFAQIIEHARRGAYADFGIRLRLVWCFPTFPEHVAAHTTRILERPEFSSLLAGFSRMMKYVVVAAISAAAHASPPSPIAKIGVAPETVEFPIPAVHARLVLSLPAWRAESVDETPYQLLQLCDQQGACETLTDLRSVPGMSIASDPSLALSPDRMYVIVLRHIGVDPTRQFFRTSVFEMYGIAERGQVAFRTVEGKRATTDNILGWDPASGHGLEVSTGHGTTAIALPVVVH